jgi:hypothetical protein
MQSSIERLNSLRNGNEWDLDFAAELTSRLPTDDDELLEFLES